MGTFPTAMTMEAPWIISIGRAGSRLEIIFRGAVFSHIRQLRCAQSNAQDFVSPSGGCGRINPQPVLTGCSTPWASAKLSQDFRRAKEAKRVKLIAPYIMAVFAMAATVANAQQPSAPTTNPADNAAGTAPVADAYVI